MTWKTEVEALQSLLGAVSFCNKAGKGMAAEKGFQSWCRLTGKVSAGHRAIYLIGNGASASMASHFAADLAKNARLHTQVFTDLSLVTAVSNDMGFEHVFAEPLKRRGVKGDMLVAISSSGKSPNILKAVDVARRLGLVVVTLSAMSPENPLRAAGDLNIHVSAVTYGHAESCHAAILHHWMNRMEKMLKPH